MRNSTFSKFRKFTGFRLLLAVGVTFFALYFCEFVLSTWNYSSNRSAAQAAGIEFDDRSVREVVQEFHRNGELAVPAVFPAIVVRNSSIGPSFDQGGVLPLSGLPEIRTVYCNESGEYAIYISDNYGFRNPKGLYSTGQIEALLVGDSFAQGACVANGQDIAGQLRSLGLRTLSLGMSDNGPLLELATLREYAVSIRPQHVFWLYYEGNDLRDLKRELESSFLQQYLDPMFSQNLREKGAQVESVLQQFLREQSNLAARRQRRQRWSWPSWVRLPVLRSHLGLLSLSKRTEEAPLAELRTILSAAKTHTASWGGTLHFVYLPEWTRFGSAFPPSRHRTEVLRMVKELRLPLIDVQETFSNAGDPLSFFPFRRPNHYNQRGYQQIALALSEAIQ